MGQSPSCGVPACHGASRPVCSDLTGFSLIVIPAALFGYALAGYPLLLWILSRFARRPRIWGDPADWPRLAILVPAYNEEASIAGTLESLLALDYPIDRREVVVMSDASSDRTDEIVRGFESRGVRLVRMQSRKGKRAAENHTLPLVTSDIVVNTDAIRIPTGSLRPLMRVFQDPAIGAASGRDVSVGDIAAEANASEAGVRGRTRRRCVRSRRAWRHHRRERVSLRHPPPAGRHGIPRGAEPRFRVAPPGRPSGYAHGIGGRALCACPAHRSLQAEYAGRSAPCCAG